MNEVLVLLEHPHPGVAILALNRPKKRNVLNISLMKAFCEKIEALQNDPSMRVVILTGAETAFCAGMDLYEAADASVEEESALWISHSLRAIYHSPLVTIAAVHGAAIGGGAGLAAACDIVIAAEGTLYGFPEVQRGLVPAQIATFLKRQLGWHQLRELLLLGELVDIKYAQSLGLINHIVPPGALMSEALKWACKALKGAPGAVRMTKQLLTALDHPTIDEELLAAMSYHLEARHSPEAREGIQAFFEKRLPRFS